MAYYGNKLKLGEILVQAKLITAEALEDALNKKGSMKIGEYLVENNIVSEDDIAKAMAEKRDSCTLGSLMQSVEFVLESQTLDRMLKKFLGSRHHLFVVLDEFGGLAGVLSLEDVIEEMLGQEIVDESDAVADLRAAARESRRRTLNEGMKL